MGFNLYIANFYATFSILSPFSEKNLNKSGQNLISAIWQKCTIPFHIFSWIDIKICLLSYKKIEKILHTCNTLPSHTCVIEEHWLYSMSLSQYHGSCQYHEFMYITWVLVNTMSPCQYHDYTMILSQYHGCCQYPELLSIPRAT